ncbi:MAG: hypothetical protein IM596_07960 [Pseudanabaena sp. M051S1SP2A07QC]|nr:hypothetical protein [Pseudanabaena sp. M051S1SP2A07QC]
MITLAGHGKDERLVQVELPIVPNVGDLIREDANSPAWEKKIESLITEGEFVEIVEKYESIFWKARLSNGKFALMAPEDTVIIDRASVLVEKEVNQSLPEQSFKVGDRVYQDNPDNSGTITRISRGKAVVCIGGDRTVTVPLAKVNHCDPNYSPKPKKSDEEILAEEESAIAKAREEYLKSQIELPFDYPIPKKEQGNECYTPDYVLEPCRKFLGRFDLDPFSNAIANRSVKAEVFWTKEDNALTKDWSSFKRKWCNPPYWKLATDGCIDKILSYIHIGETLLLVNSSTSAKWFHKCMNECSAYLHPHKRIGFYNPYAEIEYLAGKPRSSNNYDQTLFYFGDRPLEFAQALAHLGNAVLPIKKSCLPTSTYLEALEHLALPPETLAKSQQSPISTSTKTRKKSTDRTSLKSPSIATSETITHQKELISLQVDSPAQEPAKQEVKLDLTTKSLSSGLSICDVSMKDTPSLSLSKIPLDYYIVEWEKSSQAYPRAGMMRSGKFSPLPCLEVPKKERGCLSLPTLTTGLGSNRNAGATKLERFLRDKGILQNTQALSPQMMALLSAFPMDWTECLWESPKDLRAETMLEPCLDEQSISTVPPSSSNGSCTLTELSGNNIDARLDLLLEQKEKLIASGASPQGVWINCGKVPNRDFKQAVWKSDKPQPQWGDKKSQYIGKFGSDEHKSAIAQHRAGQELRRIEREIKKLQVKS